MGIFSDLYATLSFSEAHAEVPEAEPAQVVEEQQPGESKEEESEEKEGKAEEGGEDDAQEPEEEAEAEEEEEEDEPVDPKPKLEEECARSAQCAPAKSHYEHCVERVTAQQENPNHKGPKEDCVEEFFHLSHCATQCAAPKLFRILK